MLGLPPGKTRGRHSAVTLCCDTLRQRVTKSIFPIVLLNPTGRDLYETRRSSPGPSFYPT